jgi:hypothetical protein
VLLPLVRDLTALGRADGRRDAEHEDERENEAAGIVRILHRWKDAE